MSDYGLHALGMVSALGFGPETSAARLFRGQADLMTRFTLRTTGAVVPVGMTPGDLPALPADLKTYDCRNHRLAYAAYLQIAARVAELRERFGAERIGVVLGSSTAGLDATEAAYAVWRETGSLPQDFNYQMQHSMGSVSGFVAEAAGLRGPAYTLSTACTSSAKAMISARGLLDCGVCDAVITGGVDTLCHLTLNGFEALGALSREVSLPMSVNRSGLNIGEGAALFVMTREPALVNLRGAGESCDAYHMSAPQPEGLGAEAAMIAALADAGLQPRDIAYLNLHGTATPQNDSMEAKAVARTLGDTPCSSTKPFSGHCLGAAGGMEAAFCWLAMQRAANSRCPLPPHAWDGQPDPAFPALKLDVAAASIAPDRPFYFMSNSFAFGGNNCCLIFERAPLEAS